MASETNRESFRAAVRKFLDRNLPRSWPGLGALSASERELFLRDWRATLLDAGYLAPHLPVQYGGAGLDEERVHLLDEEVAARGLSLLPLPTDFFGLNMLAPTILRWGDQWQKDHFIPPTVAGEYRWAQGYSEPEAGSDLFALRTGAELRDGHWVINGQKTWQTAGDQANWIFILARTEPDRPRGAGLSLLLVPLDQPGVEVRPIRTLTGAAEFCEVFFTDAVTAARHIVGTRGKGAQVAMDILGFERQATGSTHVVYQQELDRIADLARSAGKIDDDEFRRRFGWCYSRVQMLRFMRMRSREETATGRPRDHDPSLFKLYESGYHVAATELAMDLFGMEGLMTSGDPPAALLGAEPLGAANSSATWQSVFLRARAATIYGGTSQMQRKVLAERVLGLPREPRGRGAHS
jgi:alkylation response protein AidB-like acyl-CoA dehydrogenase